MDSMILESAMSIAIDRIVALRGLSFRETASRGKAVAATHRLRKEQTIKVPHPFGTSIECLAGVVWITHDCDPKDIVLDPGQRYVADRRSRMLVHALSDSMLRR